MLSLKNLRDALRANSIDFERTQKAGARLSFSHQRRRSSVEPKGTVTTRFALRTLVAFEEAFRAPKVRLKWYGFKGFPSHSSHCSGGLFPQYSGVSPKTSGNFKSQEGCGGLGGESPGVFLKAGHLWPDGRSPTVGLEAGTPPGNGTSWGPLSGPPCFPAPLKTDTPLRGQ